jgi:hypothetical protein
MISKGVLPDSKGVQVKTYLGNPSSSLSQIKKEILNRNVS